MADNVDTNAGGATSGAATEAGAAAGEASRDTSQVAAGAATEVAEAGAQTAEQKAEADAKAAADKLTADVKTLTDAGYAKKDGETDEQFTERAGKEKADKEAAEKAEMNGAPEKYDAEQFTVPEGMELDKDRLAAVEPLFRELNLSQKGAQKLLDYYSYLEQERAKASVTAWDAQVADWKKQSASDKELGGAALEENAGYAKTAIQEFGTPELQQAIDLYGWGDHPEFFRLTARFGKAMAEAKMRTGKGSVPADASLAKRLYPNMN